ncbi:MAG: homoserine dehydrogenase [Sphingomonadales bacterium]|nr:homoserine dehydrogenase [Sphingomonadales bacterium]PIX66063.1 MAG: homoserine dehydrogenase [Sphingomonadales bacterium CG_4_10_14_3_um_filter_58_15]NCO47553.1 homoserine dehydrogenase [Sphingomonadales bacterium]NCO98944.1 homoserine dehydrogenase [Sphingomonadales bacterium]NCP26272.1 homoserine dehydrogenase [Sphingomonadales bacterium]
MTAPLRIALAGLGTVGTGVIRLIEENGTMIAQRAGRPIVVTAISARDRTRDRGIDLNGYSWSDQAEDLAALDDVDCVVELIGGSNGTALELARKSLAAGKSFVTANKAMIAHHGMELAKAAETANLSLRYEAAVAGGIPVIKGLRDGASANRIERVYGILNGTCNYILTAMEKHGHAFDDVLKEAQQIGYAEADPGFDIDGVDAAHKLAILAALSFGKALDFEGVEIDGIRNIMAADIGQAKALGYRIRLLGMARIDDGKLFQRVNPYLVPESHPLAHIEGSTNAVVAEGNFSGRLMFQGAGAGEGPTASAVVADLIDIARGDAGTVFATPASKMEPCERAESGNRIGKSYVRFIVTDKPGVLAEITAAMRDANVSIESLIQTEKTDEGSVLISMVTHDSRERDVSKSLAALSSSTSLQAVPVVMHLLSDED